MKKALIVLTNVAMYDTTKRATGLWLSELTEFYDEIVQAGWSADFVSPNGGLVPIDPHSLKKQFLSEADIRWYQDPYFQKQALAQTKRPDQINSSDYQAIYYTGGHGVMWDFPENKDLQTIAETIYANGGYVTSVCHGVVGLLNLKNDSGQYLIADRRITGFTNVEETLNGTRAHMPYLTETELVNRRAIVVKKRPLADFAVQDGQFITGQNPFSPRSVAKLLIASNP